MNFDEDREDFYEDIDLPFDYIVDFDAIKNNGDNYDSQLINGFKNISSEKISTNNSLYKEIEKETSKIYLYFIEKTKEFPKVLEKNYLSLEETYNYLKSISIRNKCECAGIIENVPAWRCADCSKYENSIYCSNCYLNSKHLHKGHQVEFLYSSGGMCDCGDPDSLYMYCTEHSGPYTEQKQIDEYINNSFSTEVLKNLKIFFDDIFSKFTEYLLLTEKCKYFYTELLEDNVKDQKGIKDVISLKNNFAIVFQNFLNFLFKITENNLGMLHLIASYLLKNNLSNEKNETTHSCIKIEKDKIEILYKDNNDIENFFLPFNFKGGKKHKCKCPFLRLLFSNWRDNVKPFVKSNSQNEKFLLSFSHNLFLRQSSCIIIFFLYKEIILNNNEDDVLYSRNQFYIEDTIEFIAKNSDFIEESYEFLYFYLKKILDSPKSRDLFGNYKPIIIEKLLNKFRIYMYDSKYFTKPKVRKIMYNKTGLLKRVIDIACLMHNIMEFKSIFPHPPFNEKKCIVELINLELFGIYIANILYLYTDFDNIDIVKEIFNYFIEKIFFLNKNKKLKEKEFSFHLLIYRIFSGFLNFFCFNFALTNKNNKADINSAIIFVKDILFKSRDEMQKVINIILNDYYKMFGFLIGIRNEYFNYYELNNYNFIYFNDLRELKHDYTLLKYLYAMTEEPVNIDYILKTSNIENVYSLFDKVFISNNYISLSKKEQISDKTQEKKSFSFSGMFNTVKNFFNIKSYFEKGLTKDEEENKHVMQWKRLLEIFICIMKNDTTPLWDILTYYDEVISLKTKNSLFNFVKDNKYLMDDIRNMLKERLIQVIIANGNLMDLKGIKEGIDKFFFVIFKEEEFNNILDELTISKMNGEKKEFYLKDSSLKYLDMNYYYSPMTKTKAELYISDFKKDTFRTYNSYYYKPSQITFDFYHKVYENFLLNVENINLILKIIDVLLQPIKKEDNKYYDLNSIRKMFLPIVLSFISMLFSINSKSFIKFKIKNDNIIYNIYDRLNNAIKYNKSNENKLFDSDLEDNIIEIINKYNSFNIIKECPNDFINIINDKDYYSDGKFKIDVNEDKNENRINISEKLITESDKKKNKAKDMKVHLKKIMQKKSEKFMKKASKNKDMKKIIEEKISKDDKTEKEEKDEIMCFYCRNSIFLKKFDKAYGKLCLVFNDLFYVNSFNSTLNSELNNLRDKNDKNVEIIINSVINNKKIINSKQPRITSCGHYFHQSCFYKGFSYDKKFKCPLCEKIQNILLPPLINFSKNNDFLKSLKFSEVFGNNSFSSKDKEATTTGDNIFKDIVINFIGEALLSNEYSKYHIFKLSEFLPSYQSCINFLINLFYSNGTTFHKQQQIEINQNILLSLRYLMNIKQIDIAFEINKVHNIITNLIKGPNHKEKIIDNYLDMIYSNYFDLILFIFAILLNYDELQKLFIYIINWVIPYMSFWLYLRNLIQKNNFYTSFDDKLNEEINIDDLKKFLSKNNTLLNKYLKLFLQKLFIIKILTNYNNPKKTELNHNIKEFSISQYFSLLNMDNLSKTLSQNNDNEINFSDLFDKIPKCFETDNNMIIYDYNEIFSKIIIRIKKYVMFKNLINAEFMIQFIPFEFKLITLDENIFDWIEKYLFKKCCICKKETKFYYICLICGEKVCCTKICDNILNHSEKCGGGSGITIYIGNLKLSFIKNKSKNNGIKETYPLYVNDSGVGPSGLHVGNEYYLSKEKYNLALKDYVSNDFL